MNFKTHWRRATRRSLSLDKERVRERSDSGADLPPTPSLTKEGGSDRTRRFKGILNQSGAALILVLTSLMILTTIVVDFAYNSHVTYEVAASERDRLKATYLARSAVNFLKLEWFVEKKLKSQFADALKQMKGAGVTAGPLCSQLPLSTAMIRAVSAGEDPFEKEEGGEETEKEETKKPEKTKKETKKGEKFDTFEGLSHNEEGFLDFDGDFEAHCEAEESKLNLNLFRGVVSPQLTTTTAQNTPATPATPAATTDPAALYEEQKKFLLSLLTQPDFDPFFKDTEERRKLTNAIADWIDANDRINEAPGIEGSLEDSEYQDPSITYQVKNGRLISLSELLLVAGMTDDIFEKLRPLVTIYGDQKINLCEAPEGTVRAFVLKYAQSAAIPLDVKDEQRWTILMTGIQQACDQPSPTPAQIASAVTTALGQTGTGGQNLASQITTANRFFTFEGKGSVEETTVTVRAVVDTANANPNLWKTLYFQVE